MSARAKQQQLLLGCHELGTFRVECPTGGVERLTQVVGGGFPVRVGPEDVHDLLAVEAVAWSKGEQLDEARSLPQAPLVILYSSRAHGNPKATEQPDPHRLRALAHRPLARHTFKARRTQPASPLVEQNVLTSLLPIFLQD
jgi:hypothetical protein